MSKHGKRFSNPEKDKMNPAALKQLGVDTKRYWLFVIISAILILASTVISVISPRLVGDLTNHIMAGAMSPAAMDMDYVTKTALIVIVLYCVTAVCSYAASFLITTAVQHYCNDLRRQIMAKINRLPLVYFDSTPTGDIMSRVTNDVDSVSQNLDQSISSLLSSVFLLVGALIMMFVTNWLMALICIATIPLMMLTLGLDMKLAEPAFHNRQHQIGVVNGVVEEDYGGQNIIKLFNANARQTAAFDKDNDLLGTYMFKAQIYGGLMMPVNNFLSNLSYIAVMLVGGLCVIDGQKFGITMGTVTSFLIYVRLFQQPFSQIAQALNSVQTISAASGRVYGFLGESELADEADKKRILVGKDGLEQVKGEVDFNHISFSYDPSREIIHDFSAKVKPGYKVAIVGPTGAGKTTMVNLLMRFYEISKGSIYVDGVNTKDMPREELHDIFGMVLQDTWVFEGTIRENLIYNSKWVSEERIHEVLKATRLDHFVDSLPGGLDHVISENSQISGGQKQLLTIARAMIRKAPLLILDEATSNVDTRTEEQIQEAMDALTEGRTSFVIAHRLSTIKNADLILVMRDGNIVEQGNHEKLLAQNGFYAGLYNSQFALE